MEFENLEQILDMFIRGGFSFPEEMMVAGIKYKTNKTSEYSIQDMVEKNYKAMWTYSTAYREQAIEAGLNHVIVFLWGFKPNTLRMIPYDVRTLSKAQLNGKTIVEMSDGNGDSITVPKSKIVGDVVDILITSLPGSKPIKGKIDTGADVSSLHADKWEVNGDRVTFLSPDLSENQITMPVIEKQAIQLSNGDTEYRPVVELNIKINDQQLSNCMFNLNDRGAMEHPILVGQNVLEAGKFFINPLINDPADPNMELEDVEVDWVAIQEEFKDDVVTGNKSDSKEQFMNEIIGFIKAGM